MKRLSIGVIIDYLTGDFQASIWRGLTDHFSSPLGYDKHHNIIYNLVSPECLDGIIISTGHLASFQDKAKRGKRQNYQAIFNIGEKQEIRAISNLCFKNLQKRL